MPCRLSLQSPLRPQPSTHNSQTAFTLIELLVAMAVLALILVLLTNIVSQIMASTRIQTQQMDSVSTARRALDIMALDIQTSVRDSTANILVPNTTGSTNLMAMASKRRGPDNSASHRLLGIRYFTDGDQKLWRAYNPISFDGPADLFTPPGQANVATGIPPLAEGILRIRINALTRTRTGGFDVQSTPATDLFWATSNYGGQPDLPSGWKALLTSGVPFIEEDWRDSISRTLEIWIAAADPQTMELLRSTDHVSTVENLLSGDPRRWRERIDANDQIPPAAKRAIQILSKRVPVP